MARLELILQAATKTTHVDAINATLQRINPEAVLISVAFVREEGIEAIEVALKPFAAKTKFFIGIRNDITSIQAVKRLLAMKIEVYAVDTGSRKILFHPKVYLAANARQAIVIIGSANLTFGGLHTNIEVSTSMKLDLSNEADKKFSDEATNAFADMLKKHPQHVFLIQSEKHADELFESGRLTDENVIPAPSTSSRVTKGERDDLPPMKLYRVIPPRIRIKVDKPVVAALKPTKATAGPVVAPPISGMSVAKYLVWESKALAERDLNIPRGATTHPTGSILLKKGAMANINPRQFFRSEIFGKLTWTPDPKKPHLERAVAKFELLVKNLNYGQFDLRLTHNSRTQTKTFQQKNLVTEIHWGKAKPLIARRDLLGRTMYLYRKDTDPPEFLIEID